MNFNIGRYVIRIRFIDKRDFSCTNIYNFVVLPSLHLYIPIKKEKGVSYRGFCLEWLKWSLLIYINRLKIGEGMLDGK